MAVVILTLNAGSSSLKFALFEGERALLRGGFEAITERPVASAQGADGAALDPPVAAGTGHEAVLPALFDWVQQHLDGGRIEAVGHRVVHGGDRFTGPAFLDDAVMAGIAALETLAPLHQGHNLAAIRAMAAAQPGLPQVACFDTAFHATMPAVARRFALPERLGVRRYGFHGLSYEWIAGTLPAHLAAGRVIVAHLGSGASLCALRDGRSVETTMGMTPLDGLVMGTRCGALDPGVVLYLMQALGMPASAVEHLLYHEAGLLGLSGVSGDMRALHASAAPMAAAAVELFAYRVAQQAGGLMAALGGVDGFVFTGGIGEHDGVVRGMVRDRLGWMGDVEFLVIPTDEEAVIARQTAGVVRRA